MRATRILLEPAMRATQTINSYNQTASQCGYAFTDATMPARTGLATMYRATAGRSSSVRIA